MSDVNVRVGLKGQEFDRGIDKLRGKLGSFKREQESAFAGLGGRLAGVFTAAAIGGFVKDSVMAAAQNERTATSFKVLLGSAEKAKALIGELQTLGASTPFEFPELATAARSLIAFGVSSKDVIRTLTSIGDISSAVGVPIGELAEIYGKARVQGRLMAEDMNQLTGRGIPVIQEFAKQFGVAEGEVKGLVSAGKIGFAQLERAFTDLTKEGGMFFNMMSEQSGTTLGKLSTLSDAWGAFKRAVAEPLQSPLKTFLEEATETIEVLTELQSGANAMRSGGPSTIGGRIMQLFTGRSAGMESGNTQSALQAMREGANRRKLEAMGPRMDELLAKPPPGMSRDEIEKLETMRDAYRDFMTFQEKEVAELREFERQQYVDFSAEQAKSAEQLSELRQKLAEAETEKRKEELRELIRAEENAAKKSEQAREKARNAFVAAKNDPNEARNQKRADRRKGQLEARFEREKKLRERGGLSKEDFEAKVRRGEIVQRKDVQPNRVDAAKAELQKLEAAASDISKIRTEIETLSKKIGIG